MNTIFSFRRFENYFKRDLLFNKNRYLYILGSILGLYILSIGFYSIAGATQPFIAILYVLVALAPCIFETKITKYNGVMEYTYPVSSTERFVMLWLRYVILFPLCTIGVYYLLSVILGSLGIEFLTGFSQLTLYNMNLNYKVIYALLAVQSVYMVGYLSFQKHSFWKTVLAQIIVLIIATITINIFFRIIVEWPTQGFTYYQDQLEHIGRPYMLYVAKYVALFLFPIGMWIVSFFKIREKEV